MAIVFVFSIFLLLNVGVGDPNSNQGDDATGQFEIKGDWGCGIWDAFQLQNYVHCNKGSEHVKIFLDLGGESVFQGFLA